LELLALRANSSSRNFLSRSPMGAQSGFTPINLRLGGNRARADPLSLLQARVLEKQNATSFQLWLHLSRRQRESGQRSAHLSRLHFGGTKGEIITHTSERTNKAPVPWLFGRFCYIP
jgi:hypothetical protein